MHKVECVHKGNNILGEMPVWSSRRKQLLWIDVRRPELYAYDPQNGNVQAWPMPQVIGSFCERRAGGLLLALKSGIHLFDMDSGACQMWLDPETHLPNNRLNDGKCDRQGRFIVGSMYDGTRLPTGTLYSVDGEKTVTEMIHGITIPNSLAWSPEGRKMYFADTPTLKIMAYDYDADTGALSNACVFRDMADHPGRPDGSTVDADGCVWNAEVHASRVVRYTPEGKIDRVIELPASGVTSCGFGGNRMDTLYITTARQNLSTDQLAQQPLAGALFALHVGEIGIQETPFLG